MVSAATQLFGQRALISVYALIPFLLVLLAVWGMALGRARHHGSNEGVFTKSWATDLLVAGGATAVYYGLTLGFMYLPFETKTGNY